MSFLLDTNVVSELKRGRRCHPNVATWHGAQAKDSLWLSVVTIAEVRKGVERLRGRDPERARAFGEWPDTLLTDYPGRVIGVDVAVADQWGRLLAQGSTPRIDALLAATAIVHGLTLVTRNVKDVAGTGAALLDPFLAA